MQTEIHNPDSNLEKNEIKSHLSVVNISNIEMRNLMENPSEASIKVKQGTWTETDGKVPLRNGGAGPCLIIYAMNTETGRLISGHFPETDVKKQDMFDVTDLKNLEEYIRKKYPKNTNTESVLVPNVDHVGVLTHIREDLDYLAYLGMLQRLKEWGTENIEIYLFGNNSEAYGRTNEEFGSSYVNSVIEQHNVSADFYKLGIPYTKQSDFRIPGRAI